MAYDQGNIDLKLNKTKGTKAPYFPVADPAWVEKVVQESLKTISAKKLVLGIPTYGYVFQLNVSSVGANAPGVQPTLAVAVEGSAEDHTNLPQTFSIPTQGWVRVRSVTYSQALDLARATNSTPVRNSAGELSFAYATTSPSTGAPVIRVAWFTDAPSIAQKLVLVRKYKLRGAYLFKFDGEADQKMWDLFK
jgi:spore germination protein YaaH